MQHPSGPSIWLHPREASGANMDVEPQQEQPVVAAESLSVLVVVVGNVPDLVSTLDGKLEEFHQRGELRVMQDDMFFLCHFRRGCTLEELNAIGNWAAQSQLPVERQLPNGIEPLWVDKGQRTRQTNLDSTRISCFRIKLAQALVLSRIRSPLHDMTCCSAFSAMKFAIKCGRVDAVKELLTSAPYVLDDEINATPLSAMRRTGTYDCRFLELAVTAAGLPEEVRHEMVVTLIAAYKERARRQDFKDPLFAILSGWKPSAEFLALQAAIEQGDTNCARALHEAGVPMDASRHTDPMERVVVESLVAGKYATATAVMKSGAHFDNVITPANKEEAMQLFGDNHALAYGYLVGKLGLEGRPPPGGWASLDPGGVKAKALYDALQTEAQLRNYKSRLLHADMQLLRADLQREEEALRIRELKAGGSALLVFACNPDHNTNKTYHLHYVLDEAVAASRSVAANIFGGTKDRGIITDRECTFSALRKELEHRQKMKQAPWGFLFAGHADSGHADGTKTLGFTTNGELAPLGSSEKDELVQLLGRHAKGKDGALELVFLSGCETLELGKAIKQQNKALRVVCWETRVPDAAGYVFSRGFFESLGSQDKQKGYDYEAAFKAASVALENKHTRRPMNGMVEVPYFVIGDPAVTPDPPFTWVAGVPRLL